MAQPAAQSFVRNATSLDSAGPEYRLHRCARLPGSCPGQSRVFYVTKPLAVAASGPAQRRSVVGMFDPRQGSLASVVQRGPAQKSRICSMASWRDGVVMCGPDGITYMNASTLQTSSLLNVDIGAAGFRCLSDIAVLGRDTSIWFTDTDFSFHDATASKIYCFDPHTRRLHVAACDVEVPVNIAFSPDSAKCYVSDAGSSSVLVYDVVPDRGSYTLANRSRFAYLDTATTRALKTDRDGNVYAACENRVVKWDKHAVVLEQIILDDIVADFFLHGNSVTVFQSQAIADVDLCHTELDARL